MARPGTSLTGGLHLAERFNIDDALVDTNTPIPVDAAPLAVFITDNYALNQRTYRWAVYADALWYNIRWLFNVIGTPAGIDAALGGTFGTLAEGLIATLVTGPSLTIPVSLRASFVDPTHNIGRTIHYGQLAASAFTAVTVQQIEVIGFRVQAQLDTPLRSTPWSDPYYIYYVDWEQ